MVIISWHTVEINNKVGQENLKIGPKPFHHDNLLPSLLFYDFQKVTSQPNLTIIDIELYQIRII